MATFMERNGRWTAIVKIKPFPRRTKTFATQGEATRWATAQEAEIKGSRPRPTSWPEIQRLPRLDPHAAAIGIYFLLTAKNAFMSASRVRCIRASANIAPAARVSSQAMPGYRAGWMS